MAHIQRKHRNGFTLIEVLVAMLLSTMLLIPIGWAIGRLGQDLQQQGSATQDNYWAQDMHTLKTIIATATDIEAVKNTTHKNNNEVMVKLKIAMPQSMGSQHQQYFLLEAIGTKKNGKSGLSLHPENPQKQHLAMGFFHKAKQADIKEQQGKTALHITNAAGAQFTIDIEQKITNSGPCIFDRISMSCR